MKKKHDLDYWLGEISVGKVDQYHTKVNRGGGLRDWHYVVTDDGVVAYFLNEQDALRFRLAEINRRLNG